jgi:hypothetical protein
MKTKRFLTPLFIACMLVAVASIHAVAQDKEDAKIRPDLKLHSSKIVEITPDITKPIITEVKSGTTVVWVNGTSNIIEFDFVGKKVTMACAAPSNFYVNDEGSFSSHKILRYSVASLCFIEKGSYDYQVTLKPAGLGSGSYLKTFKGTVTVK